MAEIGKEMMVTGPGIAGGIGRKMSGVEVESTAGSVAGTMTAAGVGGLTQTTMTGTAGLQRDVACDQSLLLQDAKQLTKYCARSLSNMCHML